VLGRRFRSKDELYYIMKYQFVGAMPWGFAGIWTGMMSMATIYVSFTHVTDLPNWYATFLGIYFGILVSMILYFMAKRNQEITDSRVKRIEGITDSIFISGQQSIKKSKFYLFYALDGIIENYMMICEEVDKWKRAKNHDNVLFHRKKILHIWENSLSHYSKILDDPEIVSNRLYDHEVIHELKSISDSCKIKLSLNEKTHEFNDEKFNLSVVRCIILLDKLKLEHRFRIELFKL
jgi:hypothetical protein